MTTVNPITEEAVVPEEKPDPLRYPKFNPAIYEGTQDERLHALYDENRALTSRVWELLGLARTCEIMHLAPKREKQARENRIPKWLRVLREVGIFAGAYALCWFAFIGIVASLDWIGII